MVSAQLFGMLGPHGKVDYSDGGTNNPTHADMNTWHFTAGTSACVVLTPTTTLAAAFRTVGKNNGNKTMYSNLAEQISAKMQLQIQQLAKESSLYHWQLDWGTGLSEWVEFV